jgi:hypothetical protein
MLITPSAWGSQLIGYNHRHQLHASHQCPIRQQLHKETKSSAMVDFIGTKYSLKG